MQKMKIFLDRREMNVAGRQALIALRFVLIVFVKKFFAARNEFETFFLRVLTYEYLRDLVKLNT